MSNWCGDETRIAIDVKFTAKQICFFGYDTKKTHIRWLKSRMPRKNQSDNDKYN